ncbi:MAG: DUF29 family protein [Aphanizomenon gracile PMC638.10]|nr:DUF29 family protein [Aphanizomenon gracile PMC638.10]
MVGYYLNQLQNRDLENLDWEHLIEEITALETNKGVSRKLFETTY